MRPENSQPLARSRPRGGQDPLETACGPQLSAQRREIPTPWATQNSASQRTTGGQANLRLRLAPLLALLGGLRAQAGQGQEGVLQRYTLLQASLRLLGRSYFESQLSHLSPSLPLSEERKDQFQRNGAWAPGSSFQAWISRICVLSRKRQCPSPRALTCTMDSTELGT